MALRERLSQMIKKFTLLLLVFLVNGCIYYSMAGSIPAHINSIAIPIVENQTAEFGMSESVTENLLLKFNEENILRVTDEDQATSILRGTIIRVTDAPYTFTKQEAVTEYRFTVHMRVEWFDVRDDKVLIEKDFSGWGAYGLSGDISSDTIDNDGDGMIDGEDNDEFGDPREFATAVAVTKIAEDVLNEIMTSW
jgi:hypothetical protein